MMDREQLSAWMDGEAEPEHSRFTSAEFLADPELGRSWREWHLVGDTLRSASLAVCRSSVANRVSARLANEPIHFVRQPKPVARASKRSRLVYGGAVAAAVAFVSVVALAPQMQSNFGELVAIGVPETSSQVVAAQPLTPVMLSDPRLSELMEAHGSMSIRTVSEVR